MTAEELASFEIWKFAKQRAQRSERYCNLLRARIDLDKAGEEEDLAEVIKRMDEYRATDILQSVLAGHALTDLTDVHRRVAFACLVWRYEHDHWPRVTALQKFIGKRFGWSSPGRMIERTINDRSGLFFIDESRMAEIMEFPLPEDEADHTIQWRCYVSAETQVDQGLHRIYRAWAFKPVTEGTAL